MNDLTKTYSAKNIRDTLGISPKTFKQMSEKLKILYDIDLSRYREDPDGNSSNFKLNLYEVELLTILFKAVNEFPFKVTEQNFYDEQARQKAKYNTPESFLKFIASVAENIDAIEDIQLKTHLFASDSYDETREYLSARQKLQQSLSNFIQYTGTLDSRESSKRQRELAYRIDEMLFELMDEKESINDIDVRDEGFIWQENPTNLQNFHARFEFYKKKDSPETLPPENEIKDQLLDYYIVDMLNDMYSDRESMKKSIKEKYEITSKNEDIENQIRIMQQSLKVWDVMDPFSIEIQNSYHENFKKVEDTVDYYYRNNYRKMNYADKLKLIHRNYKKTEAHQYFSFHLQNFYKELQKITILADLNRDRFIQDGIAPEMIDHFIYDTKRIYKLINNYNITGNIEGTKDSSERFSDLLKKFEMIKTTMINDNYVNMQTEKLTSWNFADKMEDILSQIRI